MPVEERIVERKLYPLGLARLGELADYVALERRGADVVVVDLGWPKREAVVVARRDRDVLRAGFPDDPRPFACVVLRRVESMHHALVGVAVEATVVQIPLALRVVGVDSPHDEHAVAVRGKLLASLEVPLCGLVLRRRRAKRDCRNRCGCNQDSTFHRFSFHC